jgi:hypothetical protein
MYDPFIDSLYEGQPLQTPLSPSHPVTPAVNPAAFNVKIYPTVPRDAAALFDPLGFIPTNSCVIQVPAMAPTTRATLKPASGTIAQRQVGILTISTPTNPPPVLVNYLEALLGMHDTDDASQQPQANSTVSTRPLFQAPQMIQSHPVVPLSSRFSCPNPHVRGTSDNFVTFVSLPPSLDPLSSADSPFIFLSPLRLAEVSSGSEYQPCTATTIANEVMLGARQRHAENATRVPGELVRDEGSEVISLARLDNDVRREDRTVAADVLERRLRMEPGSPSPPTTPTYFPPPTTRVLKIKGCTSGASYVENGSPW